MRCFCADCHDILLAWSDEQFYCTHMHPQSNVCVQQLLPTSTHVPQDAEEVKKVLPPCMCEQLSGFLRTLSMMEWCA